jgi:hypothetical protein
MVMFMLLATVVALQDAAELPWKGGGTTQPMSGRCTLSADSRWHKFTLALVAREKASFAGEELAALRPPSRVKPGDTWTTKEKSLDGLVKRLHAAAWSVDDGESSKLQKWLGQDPREAKLETAGSLTVTLEARPEGGWRLAFGGTLTVADTGTFAGRFGPNSWRITWKHALKGALLLDAAGGAERIDLKDTFEATGAFHNGGACEEDPFTRKGTLEMGNPPPPLTVEQEKKVRELIERLGDDDAEARDAAARALRGYGEAAAPLLRDVGLKSADSEVRERCRAILKDLLLD